MEVTSHDKQMSAKLLFLFNKDNGELLDQESDRPNGGFDICGETNQNNN